MNRLLISCFLALLILACSRKETSSESTGTTVDGAAVYKKNCVLCHGKDGNLGVNGSKDIRASVLTKAERIELITHGRKLMTPFKGVLSEDEIKAVAEYTMTMK